MIPYLYTYNDVQLHLADWAGFSGAASPEMQRKIKRAIDNSYRALTNLHDWTYYVFRGRINTNAMYATGTITYTNSTRTVTLSGGTLPSYTNLSIIRVGPVDYQVAQGSTNIGTGTCQLSVNSNPGQDLAAGTAYTLYQDLYVLPVNFRSMGTLKDANYARLLQYVPPNDMIASRQIFQVPTLPFRYTLRSDISYMAMNAIQFYPAPNNVYQYDYMGYRYPRPFTQPVAYTTGTISTSGTTVTGTGTTFTSNMVGCILRISNSTTAPTGMYGSTPYYAQRVITGYVSATSITTDVALDAEQTGVAFEISDPIDMDAAALYTAFLRLCEFEIGKILNRDDVSRLERQYQSDLVLAMEADNRSSDTKPGGYRSTQRVSDYQPLIDANN